jgi:hypothetical protein
LLYDTALDRQLGFFIWRKEVEMKKHQKQIFALAVTVVFTATVLFLTGLSEAGKHEKPDPVMDMLEDIYEVVVDTNSKVGVPASVPQTGQTACYNTAGAEIICDGTGQDGELLTGAAWPDPRFTVNIDGTATDNLTGLIWLGNANCFNETPTWATALNDANGLASGDCELTDGSSAGDWRLPNLRELHSLIDFSNSFPAVPNTAGTGQWTSGDPFTGVRSGYYWSSTTDSSANSDRELIVSMNDGSVVFGVKGDVSNSFYVWPVRDGN